MKTLAYLLLTVAVSYCCGNLNGAIITSTSLYKSDVREQGSGNAGLSNFYRCYGPATATLVILIDILKAVIAVSAGKIIMGVCGLPESGQGAALVGVMIGHMFPVAYQFRGGKGVLSAFSCMLIIDWRVALGGFAVFLVIVALTRYISLGSMLGAALMPVGLFVEGDGLLLTLFGAVCGAMIIFMHRANIKRLLAGTESKFAFRKSAERG